MSNWMLDETSAFISAVDPAEVNSSIPVDFLMSSSSETAGLLCVTGYFQLVCVCALCSQIGMDRCVIAVFWRTRSHVSLGYLAHALTLLWTFCPIYAPT